MSLPVRFFGSTTFPSGASPLRVPILSGPMAGAAGGALAAAVTRGGGLGFCGAGTWDAAKAASEVQEARSALGMSPVSEQGSQERVPIGAGFLVWRLAQLAGGKLPAAHEGPQASSAHALVHALVNARLASAWFSFGSLADTEAWVSYFRHWDAQLSPPPEEPVRIVLGVGNAKEAEQALRMNPQALALTGNEGGGHGLNASPPLSELLAQVRALVHPLGSRAPLLFAAGGLATGQDAAKMLDQGADGVIFGTRYLLTPESSYTDVQKDLLLKAGSTTSTRLQGYGPDGPTVRSYAFDYARKTTAWPPGVDGRGLRSKTVDEYDPTHPEASSQTYDGSDPQRVVTWAGTGVDRMHDVLPATELTLRLASEITAAQR